MNDLVFLVVDDSQAVRSLVKTAVYTQFGTQKIYTAGNGLQAKEILLSKKVDVIISDWEMPKMNGQELLAFVKGSEKLRDIPFIMMTSRDGKESVLHSIQNGVSHYVVKPFTTEKLEGAVRRAWGAFKKQKESRIAGLPKHQMKISTSGKLLDGKIQNISRSGALLDVSFDSVLTLFSQVKVHINMELPGKGLIKAHNLSGRVIRLQAQDGQDFSNTACSVAVIFEHEKCDKSGLESLQTVINFVTESLPKIVDNSENEATFAIGA